MLLHGWLAPDVVLRVKRSDSLQWRSWYSQVYSSKCVFVGYVHWEFSRVHATRCCNRSHGACCWGKCLQLRTGFAHLAGDSGLQWHRKDGEQMLCFVCKYALGFPTLMLSENTAMLRRSCARCTSSGHERPAFANRRNGPNVRSTPNNPVHYLRQTTTMVHYQYS